MTDRAAKIQEVLLGGGPLLELGSLPLGDEFGWGTTTKMTLEQKEQKVLERLRAPQARVRAINGQAAREARKNDAREKLLVGVAQIAVLGRAAALRWAMDHLAEKDRQWIGTRIPRQGDV